MNLFRMILRDKGPRRGGARRWLKKVLVRLGLRREYRPPDIKQYHVEV